MAKKRRTAAQIRATRKLVAMNKARARGNPGAGYTVGDVGTAGTLSRAREMAKRAIRRGAAAAPIYSNATNRLVENWVNKKNARGDYTDTPTRKNPAGPSKTPLRRLKSALQLRRGKKATAEWVRAGMPAQRNRPRKKAQCNPKRRGPTLTMAQGRKLYEMGKRAPKTPIAMKTNGNKVSIVTGKAARRLAKRS